MPWIVIKDIIYVVFSTVCRIGSVAGFLIFAFVVFIVYLRYKLPSGGPKPPICTTTKVRIRDALCDVPNCVWLQEITGE